MSPDKLTRRDFTRTAALSALAASSSLTSLRGQNAPSEKLVVGVMGLGRGKAHIKAWLQVPGVEIAYVCDVDSDRLAEGGRVVQSSGQEKPAKEITDFRKILEDPDVDIISIAAPNYWHAPATIMACNAGKHVYVEKPGSHNIQEGLWMAEAARKHDRKVQMGNQRRSYPSMIEGMAKLKEGIIGKPLYGRAYYFNQRPDLGKGKPASIPASLVYDLWLGPVPEYPYKDNLVPYNWHWHWHFGGGEVANNGVHSMDVARWAMELEYPSRVSYLGNRYHYDDDQETPDTGTVVFDFPEGMGISWEHSSCHRRKPEKPPFVSIACEGGMMSTNGTDWTFYDIDGNEIHKVPSEGGDHYHFQNLADAIRAGVPLNSEIEDAQKSTRWCHLANMSFRTRQMLEIDPATGNPLNSPEAMEFFRREYRDGWEPKV